MWDWDRDDGEVSLATKEGIGKEMDNVPRMPSSPGAAASSPPVLAEAADDDDILLTNLVDNVIF